MKSSRRLQKSREFRWGAAVAAALVLLGMTFFLPLIHLLPQAEGTDAQPEETVAVLPPTPQAVQADEGQADSARSLKVLLPDGTTEEMTLSDYLCRVVSAEMPASFESEALKAQAVAARSYTLWKMSHATAAHPQADVCSDPACCQAYLDPAQAAKNWGDAAEENADKIRAAVAGTDGMVLEYGGEVIQAVFFSSASGATEDAVAVWGNSVPYLVSVSTPEGTEVPGFTTSVTLTGKEAKALILARWPEADLAKYPGKWFTDAVRGEGGAVETMKIGGVEVTGAQARAAFSLRSADFTWAYDGTSFTFTVTGHGHGVGMSQYGANAMAKAGSSWQDIVLHYYSGAQLAAM